MRNDYEELFLRHGISRQELCSMTEVEFQKTLKYFLSENPEISNDIPDARTTSQYRYVSAKLVNAQVYAPDNYNEEEALQIAIMNSLEDQDQHSANSNSSISEQSPQAPVAPPYSDFHRLREEQDRDFRAACEEAQQQTFDARNQEIFNANEAIIAEENQQERDGEVIARYYSLPSEPTSGTTIAVVVNGERCVRKFNSHCPAADVYSWVAGQTIHTDENKLYFDEFELVIPGRGVLDPERTLEEQGMTGRMMVHVHQL
jgi:hypothetical protein